MSHNDFLETKGMPSHLVGMPFVCSPLHAGGEQFFHRGAKRVGLRPGVGGVLALYGEVCLELGLGARRPDD